MDRAVLQFLASFAIILRIYDALHLQQTRHFIADHQSICQLRRSAQPVRTLTIMDAGPPTPRPRAQTPITYASRIAIIKHLAGQTVNLFIVCV